MLVGYARVSTIDQNPELQLYALKKAGCEKIYVETASGAHRERPQLAAALSYLREGDTLVIWKLSRLARPISSSQANIGGLNSEAEKLMIRFRPLPDSTPASRSEFATGNDRVADIADLRIVKSSGWIRPKTDN